MKSLLMKAILSFPTMKIRNPTRINLEIQIKKQFKRLKPGIVLDIGAKGAPFKDFIPHTKYITLDVSENSKPDICCDAHRIKSESNHFDTVLATELLEHTHTPQKVVDEIHRILKSGGVCILSTRFICPYHPDPKDYFRFSKDGLLHLFRNFKKVEIYHQGNRVLVMWTLVNRGVLMSLFLNIFNPLIARINVKRTYFPNGYIVYAVK